MYRGKLKDGSLVAIRYLKLKQNYGTQNFMQHIEMILKLRHRHLVSSLGHCFECNLDDSSVHRIFLIFEYAPNGTLRSWTSGNPWNIPICISLFILIWLRSLDGGYEVTLLATPLC